MSDELPTIWSAEPHTLAKHGILKGYLEAWAIILSVAPPDRRAKEILFVDGFAGPGEYIGGELGSPLVALNAILKHNKPFARPVRLRFIENDRDRHCHLRQRLAKEEPGFAGKSHVIVEQPILGDCAVQVRKILSERKPVGPALFFLDQFGYSQVPMALLTEIMAHDTCEVFSYLNCSHMNHFLSDKTKWPGITEAYGDDSWKPALEMSGDSRQEFLIETYKDAIRRHAETAYTWSFAMFNENGLLINWLVFATNHPKGLFEMKRAMWTADRKGEYRFSDRVDAHGQQHFFSMLGEDECRNELADRLAGQTLTEDQLRDFVLTKTRFYKYKNDINQMRRDGLVSPEKAGQWPVTFAPRQLKLGS